MVVRTPPWGVHFNAPRRHAFRNPISKAHRLVKVFTLRISELQPRFRARIRETAAAARSLRSCSKSSRSLISMKGAMKS